MGHDEASTLRCLGSRQVTCAKVVLGGITKLLSKQLHQSWVGFIYLIPSTLAFRIDCQHFDANLINE